MRTSGVWYVSASGNTEEKHFPSGVSNGWLQIYAFNGEVKQLFYRFGTANVNDSQIFVRTFYTPSQSWSNWVRLITNTDLGGAVFKTASGNIQYGMNGIYLGRFANGPLQSDGDSFAACIYLIGTGAGQTAAYVFPITQYSEGHLLFNRMGYDSLWELTNWKKLIA